MRLTDRSGDELSSDEKARLIQAGKALEEDYWESYPPTGEELRDDLEVSWSDGYQEEVSGVLSILEKTESSERTDSADAALFKIIMHLQGNFVSYKDVSDLYSVDSDSYRTDVKSEAHAIKDYIGLDESLRSYNCP